MTVRIDVYSVRLAFKRLFPDPKLFQSQSNLARFYLQEKLGLDESKSRLIQQRTHFSLTDRKGNPAKTSGVASYILEGKKTRSEYMKDVILQLDYQDLGTGIPSDEHHRAWQNQVLWTMHFTLETFQHEHITLDIPSMNDLYTMIKDRAQPTTIASLELAEVPDDRFDLALAYLETQLRILAENDKATLEVYASRYLEPSEKQALDTRLTKESTPATVYVILGKS
ncbi:MAG TPA: hypothetical protein VE177_07205 [Candidatus Binatus sp.]|nr:hypothetical protein [Candidatus Binatus sp.]